MLCDWVVPKLSEFDESVYARVVPEHHYLRTVLEVVDWDRISDLLAVYYCTDMGRPADPPVMLLKLEYLRYHHNLSDREVIARAQTDLAFRYFLQLPLRGWLPGRCEPPRQRSGGILLLPVGCGRYTASWGRAEHGVVKDRLRIKDATNAVGTAMLARRAKHGEWFEGNLTDILVDADIEIITAVNVMPANGNEAKDAVELIRLKEAAHGNDVEAMSIDGGGFDGCDLFSPWVYAAIWLRVSHELRGVRI